MKSIFTNRHGGFSHGDFASANLAHHVGDLPEIVATNRAALAQDFPNLVFMNQVHGDLIKVVEDVPNEILTCDALITQNPNISLAVMVADCLPLLLSSDSLIGAVHVGRAGLINSIAIKTVIRMRELGATQISALIGPAICGRCYEVPSDLHDEVTVLHPSASSRTKSGTTALDLPKALMTQLEILEVNTVNQEICTYENLDFFSYRRNKMTGRQAGVIKL